MILSAILFLGHSSVYKTFQEYLRPIMATGFVYFCSTSSNRVLRSHTQFIELVSYLTLSCTFLLFVFPVEFASLLFFHLQLTKLLSIFIFSVKSYIHENYNVCKVH